MNLQTYSEDNFLSLELAVGGQIWKVKKNDSLYYPQQHVFQQRMLKSKQKRLQTHSGHTFLSLELAGGVRSDIL